MAAFPISQRFQSVKVQTGFAPTNDSGLQNPSTNGYNKSQADIEIARRSVPHRRKAL
jgi:hypothetical protein